MTTSLYQSTDIIQSTHQLPHFNSELHLTSNNFELSKNYVLSISIIPIIIFIILFLLISIFYCVLCFKNYNSKYIKKNNLKKSYIYLLPITIVIISQVIIIGIVYMNQGLIKSKYGLSKISIKSINIINELNVVSNKLNYINNNDFLNPNCIIYQNTNLFQNITTSFQNIEIKFNNTINSLQYVPKKINQIKYYINKYGINLKDYIFFIIYGVIIFCSLLFILLLYHGNNFISIKFILCLSFILILILLLLTCLQMIIMIAYADYCIAPEVNTLKLIDNQLTKNILSHFMYCNNPFPTTSTTNDNNNIYIFNNNNSINNNYNYSFIPKIRSLLSSSSSSVSSQLSITSASQSLSSSTQSSISSIFNLINIPNINDFPDNISTIFLPQLNNTINQIINSDSIISSCKNVFINNNFNILSIIKSLKNNIFSVVNLLNCNNIQSIWLDSILHGICTKGFTGFYIIWITLWIIIILILITISYLCYILNQNLYDVRSSSSSSSAEVGYHDGNFNQDSKDNNYDNDGVRRSTTIPAAAVVMAPVNERSECKEIEVILSSLLSLLSFI